MSPRAKLLCLLPLLGGLAAAAQAAALPRVVTLAPHLTELVCAASGCERLVAVSAYSDYPPEVRALPSVGDVSRLNLEALIAFRPTHILAWQGGTPAAQRAQMKRLRLPVTAVDIARLDEVPAAIERIGTLLGTVPRAAAAASDYRRRLAELKARRAAAPGAPLRVLYQIETAPVYTVNGASPISALVTLCGGINVFASLPTLAAAVSDEAVLAAGPEVVLHAVQDADAIRRYWSRYAKAARQPPQLVGIDPDLIARAGPRMIDGAEQLCAALDGVRAVKSAAPGPAAEIASPPRSQ